MHELRSPNSRLVATFRLHEGVPTYSLKVSGKEIIAPSPMGLRMRQGEALDAHLRVLKVARGQHDETWEQPWGEQRIVRDRHREMRIELGSQAAKNQPVLAVVFRAFDEGLAFRYELPKVEGETAPFELMDEKTGFNIPGAKYVWWTPAGKIRRYEYLYKKTAIDALPDVHTPLTIELSSGAHISIHEAALVDYAAMFLRPAGNHRLKAELFAWKDGTKVKGQRPFKSPWRTIQFANKAVDLLRSTMILNLNEPNKLGDISWVKPQKYIGIWWGMHLQRFTWGAGPKHGATTKNAKRYIDFASKNGIPALLVEGWNLGWNDDWIAHPEGFVFDKPYPDFDIERVIAYGKKRGVSLIGHHETAGALANYEAQMERAFAYYAQLGVSAVKMGYVDDKYPLPEHHHGQYMVRHFHKVAEIAAKYRIALDFHEPIKDTGLRRTYPHLITREGVRGTEFDAWSEDGGNPPEHTATLPFTRGLAGPTDYTPGIFDLRFKGGRHPSNRTRSTLAKQLALYVVIYSPLQMAADLPENYEGKPAFQFIRDVPVDWEISLPIEGAVGEYVVVARKDRQSENWYLGGLTNEKERNLDIALDFLDEAKPYRVELYRDSDDAHWESNPEAVKIETLQVKKKGRLRLKLAPGGGFAARIVPVQ